MSRGQEVRADATISDCSESSLNSALAKGGQIVFTCGGTIDITTTKVISTRTVLDASAAAAAGATISTANGIRLFTINPGVSLTIIGLTLSDGSVTGTAGAAGASGGAAFGGAIYNNGGTLVAINTSFLSNSVTGGAGGAGVSSTGGISGNGGAGGLAYGAAIYNNAGSVSLTNCLFTGNVTVGGIGGAGADATPAGFSQNGGNGGSGGEAGGAAIYNSANGTVTAVDCTFFGNQSTATVGATGGLGDGVVGFPGNNGPAGAGNGGAVFNSGGTMIITFSTLNANNASGANGLDGRAGDSGAQGSAGSPGGSAYGGGILNSSGVLALTNCTVFGNTVTGGTGGAGGAGGGSGFGGDGGDGGTGGSGSGGGISNLGTATATLVSVTLSENVATGGAGGPGGIGGGIATPGQPGSAGANSGGALSRTGGLVTIKNSILAYSISSKNAAGTIVDGGNNLSSDATPILTSASSQNNVDPKLGDLADNGGPTQTVAVAPGSPAINAGNPAAGLPIDQRHYARSGQGDIGAFELDAQPASATLSLHSGPANVVVSWPVSAPGYRLQSTPSLAPTAWTDVTNPPVVIGFDYTVTNALGPLNSFYRLIH